MVQWHGIQEGSIIIVHTKEEDGQLILVGIQMIGTFMRDIYQII